MKRRALNNIGIIDSDHVKAAFDGVRLAREAGVSKRDIQKLLEILVSKPEEYRSNAYFGSLAALLIEEPPETYELQEDLSFSLYNDAVDEKTIQQMENACSLPIARKAALMPDAHVGYGIPIGGVLGTEGAVIPYAVGVDIACRVMVSVYDEKLSSFNKNKAKFGRAIEKETRFGIGARFENPRQHDVMDPQLADHHFIAGEEYTIADIAVWSW